MLLNTKMILFWRIVYHIFLLCTLLQASGDDSFDARMTMIARRHSHLYTDPQTLNDQSQHSTHSIDQSQHRHSSQSLSSNDRTDQSVPRQHSAMTIQTEHELSHTDRKLPQRSATFTSHRSNADSSSRGQRSSRKDSRPPRSDASEYFNFICTNTDSACHPQNQMFSTYIHTNCCCLFLNCGVTFLGPY